MPRTKEPGKYRKKPVVVEAMLFDGSVESAFAIIGWATALPVESVSSNIRFNAPGHSLTIPTLEGNHRADKGDWIIKGVADEFYPCKPEIFDLTYEACPE